MQKQITEIHMIFENCESYAIPMESIEFLNVRGFRETQSIGYYSNGLLSTTFRANSFILKLKNLDKIKSFYEFSEPFSKRVCQDSDICSITYVYENSKDFSFYVPWDYSNSQYNSWQHIKENKDGSLEINIKMKYPLKR